MTAYRIVPYLVACARTDEWNPRQVRETLWRVEGPGVNRPATVEEIDIMRGVAKRAVELVRPFTPYVNIAEAGGDPETVLRKEFGL